jgi:hypothetical protein
MVFYFAGAVRNVRTAPYVLYSVRLVRGTVSVDRLVAENNLLILRTTQVVHALRTQTGRFFRRHFRISFHTFVELFVTEVVATIR